MTLLSCPDCGGTVSDKAASCPHCGHPVSAAMVPLTAPSTASSGDAQASSPIAAPPATRPRAQIVSPGVAATIIISAVVLFVVLAQSAEIADTETALERARAPARSDSSRASASLTGPSGFQSTVANIVPGKALYLRSDHALVGTVADVESRHAFPDGTARSAVLIHFVDGTADWVPRETVHLLYVTR